MHTRMLGLALPIALLFGGAAPPMGNQLVYRETFEKGPGVWTMGKSIEKPKGSGYWHQNILGYYGEGAPLGYSPHGGPTAGAYAYTFSPWYFDDNHGEFAWIHLVFTARSEALSIIGKDLRDGVVNLRVRGNGLDLKGTQLMLWIQGLGGVDNYYTGRVFYNWALSSQAIDRVLLDGNWHDVSIRLENNERKWSPMGLIHGASLLRKITVIQSLTVSAGSLDGILGGAHYSIGFLLAGVDGRNPPTGRIDIDEISIVAGENEQSKEQGRLMLEHDRKYRK